MIRQQLRLFTSLGPLLERMNSIPRPPRRNMCTCVLQRLCQIVFIVGMHSNTRVTALRKAAARVSQVHWSLSLASVERLDSKLAEGHFVDYFLLASLKSPTKFLRMDAANQFGRGTPAGNAIYRLYNKKSMDSTLDPELLARLQKMRKEREAAEAAVTKVKATPKSQVHVEVPKFGRRSTPMTDEQRALARLNAMGHRKREGDIKEEVKNSEPVCQPAPSRPAITDKEKDKLAQIFQFGEVLPPVTQFTGANAARVRRPTEEERLESRFEELSELLAEKKSYLAEIRQGVAGGKSVADRRQAEMICTNDIAQMIQEMKSIDVALRDASSSAGQRSAR